MSYKDLRTGNYVYHATTLSQVFSILKDVIVLQYNSGGEDKFAPLAPSGVKLVKINHYWLQYLGFENVENNIFKNEDVIICTPENSKPVIIFKNTNLEDELFEIEFIHHIQNLYFSRRRKELFLNYDLNKIHKLGLKF